MEIFGKDLAQKHKNILLNGELAAGKTTFVRGFVQWLWLDHTQVSSPTYAYLNIYDQTVVHIDMYRLEQENELIEKWLLDAIMDHEYVLIERPKRTEHYIDETRMSLVFEKDGDIRSVIVNQALQTSQ